MKIISLSLFVTSTAIVVCATVLLIKAHEETKALRDDIMSRNGQIKPGKMKEINKVIDMDYKPRFYEAELLRKVD